MVDALHKNLGEFVSIYLTVKIGVNEIPASSKTIQGTQRIIPGESHQ
ncbi:MAG: hypothetical protein KKD44_04685 [Proteobacteria bacterium]|nr:hypothetical protein [Pseudomonadota bacterium]